MKFGKELARLCVENPRYRNGYLNYKELKRAVKALGEPTREPSSGAIGGTPQTPAASSTGVSMRRQEKLLAAQGVPTKEAAFAEQLRHQLEKVNNFVALQVEVIRSELKTRVGKGHEKSDQTFERTNEAEKQAHVVKEEAALDRLAEEIVSLDGFIRANYTGFRKITKKCDKKNDTAFSKWFMPIVESAPFRQHDFELVLDLLSRCYSKWHPRAARAGLCRVLGEQSAEVAEDELVEAFLVPPERVMRAKVLLVKHMQCQPHGLPGQTEGDQYLQRRAGNFAAGMRFRCRLAGDERRDASKIQVLLEVDGPPGSGGVVEGLLRTGRLVDFVDSRPGMVGALRALRQTDEEARAADDPRPHDRRHRSSGSSSGEGSVQPPPAEPGGPPTGTGGARASRPGAVAEEAGRSAGPPGGLGGGGASSSSAAKVPKGEGKCRRRLRAAAAAVAERARRAVEGRPDQDLSVDCKTPLANERTVLRWLRSAVMLSTLSAFLSSRDDDASQINGLLLALVALLFVFWPYCIFHKRSLSFANAKAIGGQPKSDKTLPQVLALSLCGILSAVLAVHLLFGSAPAAQGGTRHRGGGAGNPPAQVAPGLGIPPAHRGHHGRHAP